MNTTFANIAISPTKANRLYWLGRYAERVVMSMHLLRKYANRAIDGDREATYDDFCTRMGIPMVADAETFESEFLYSATTDVICHDMAKQSWLSVLRFARWVGACDVHVLPGARSYVFADDALRTVMSDRAGILYARATVGQTVRRNDLLAKVLDPFTGQALQEIISPADGVIFFAHTKNLIHQHSRVFQVLTIN